MLTSSAFAPPPPQSDGDQPSDAPSQQQQQPPPLPQPQSFDILPPLHALLSRLEPGLEAYTTSPSAPLVTGHNDDVDRGGGLDHHGDVLQYKDAAVAAGFLKTRIRKTLAELKGLGDMDRTVEEQEREIGELERRIELQRKTLAKLGEEARGLLEVANEKMVE